METPDKKYLDALSVIENDIQSSELLTNYLEEEEEEQYKAFQTEFEPRIAALHDQVARENPLQIISFEKALLTPGLEGLFLPRILGYSVLRGELNDEFKYKKPQNHFKEILLTICNSSNFDILKQRIGQSIQMGFGFSSDIWITNIYNEIVVKRVKQYLMAQKLDKFRDIRTRHTNYLKFKKQFENFNYLTAEFPKNLSELKQDAYELKQFLLYRSFHKFDNSSFDQKITDLIENDVLTGDLEYVKLMFLIGMFYDLNPEAQKSFTKRWNNLREEYPEFQLAAFKILNIIINEISHFNPSADKKLSALIDKTVDDEISKYYKLMDVIHGKGYVHSDAIEAVKSYYELQKGLSIQNECVRSIIFSYSSHFLNNLEVNDYPEYFEINKTYNQYMNIFSNEKFNQNIKGLSLKYVKRLLKTYTDKRGKDYQDIKKYVSAAFLDQGFLKEKQIVELFKTRRKKKVS